MSVSQTTITAIQDYYQGRRDLTAHQEALMTRLEATFSLLCKWKLKPTVVKFLIKMDWDGSNISQAQAYRYIQCAEQLYGNIRKYHRATVKVMLTEAAFRDARNARKLAKKNRGNPETYARLMRVADAAEKRIIKVQGLDREDEAPDFSLLEPNSYEVRLDESSLAALEAIADGRGSVNLGELYDKEAIELQFNE